MKFTQHLVVLITCLVALCSCTKEDSLLHTTWVTRIDYSTEGYHANWARGNATITFVDESRAQIDWYGEIHTEKVSGVGWVGHTDVGGKRYTVFWSHEDKIVTFWLGTEEWTFQLSPDGNSMKAVYGNKYDVVLNRQS